MNIVEISKKVKAHIMEIAEDKNLDITYIADDDSIVEDIGLASLDVATLISLLERTFHVDPFALNLAVITEIQTVSDICNIYAKCLNKA